ncbi:hypothetical protein GW17_00059972 [Ensete ventricosum]|nr:hypothetical protein GW17_00059972 [Ensete ventricosum]
MHPLRFPNSGIRAKVFVRMIGFKLRVMRLNRVESFNAFLLRFCNEGNKEEGQQGMARPPARGWSAVAKAPLQRGDRLRLGPLQRAAANKGSSRPRARPTAASPQGAAARGAPARCDRQWPARKGGRPLVGHLSSAKGSRRLRRARGLGHPFEKRMILPL